MARPQEAAKLVKSGAAPSEIAQEWRISHKSVVQYLHQAVGLGLVSRSEILFAINEGVAQAVEESIASHTLRNRRQLELAVKKALGKPLKLAEYCTGEGGRPPRTLLDDFLLYFDLREAPLADMYESLCRLEGFLHGYIRDELKRGFGPKDWWRKGIPAMVRKDCDTRWEDDLGAEAEAYPPYCYTTFIHLKEIFDKQWGLFSKLLPNNTAADKQRFISDLTRANTIRNKVMHPVRGYRPTRDDYDFIKDFAARMFAEPA
jgi:predicted transcriptional regulator